MTAAKLTRLATDAEYADYTLHQYGFPSIYEFLGSHIEVLCDLRDLEDDSAREMWNVLATITSIEVGKRSLIFHTTMPPLLGQRVHLSFSLPYDVQSDAGEWKVAFPAPRSSSGFIYLDADVKVV